MREKPKQSLPYQPCGDDAIPPVFSQCPHAKTLSLLTSHCQAHASTSPSGSQPFNVMLEDENRFSQQRIKHKIISPPTMKTEGAAVAVALPH